MKGFLSGSAVKKSTCNAGDTGDVSSVFGLGRSLGGGNGDPLQYSCQENPMDRGDWQATVCGVSQLDTTEHTCTQSIQQVLVVYLFMHMYILCVSVYFMYMYFMYSSVHFFVWLKCT